MYHTRSEHSITSHEYYGRRDLTYESMSIFQIFSDGFKILSAHLKVRMNEDIDKKQTVRSKCMRDKIKREIKVRVTMHISN
jgi:hypothetical protein